MGYEADEIERQRTDGAIIPEATSAKAWKMLAQKHAAERDDAIRVLKGLMVAYDAVDGRNGTSGECWDNAREFLGRLRLWTKDRGFI